jgi:hypothetical protein
MEKVQQEESTEKPEHIFAMGINESGEQKTNKHAGSISRLVYYSQQSQIDNF